MSFSSSQNGRFTIPFETIKGEKNKQTKYGTMVFKTLDFRQCRMVTPKTLEQRGYPIGSPFYYFERVSRL